MTKHSKLFHTIGICAFAISLLLKNCTAFGADQATLDKYHIITKYPERVAVFASEAEFKKTGKSAAVISINATGGYTKVDKSATFDYDVVIIDTELSIK